MIRVRLPAGYEVTWVEVEAASVRQLLGELDQRFPGIVADLESGMSVAINGDIVADALYEPLPPDAEVHFLPPISGGS